MPCVFSVKHRVDNGLGWTRLTSSLCDSQTYTQVRSSLRLPRMTRGISHCFVSWIQSLGSGLVSGANGLGCLPLGAECRMQAVIRIEVRIVENARLAMISDIEIGAA